MKNYQQGFYVSQLKDIASDQNKALQYVYLEIKKLSFVYAVKKGDELAIMMKLQLHKNSSGSKQTNLLFYFIDGVSEDNKTNELFLQISRFVQYWEIIKSYHGRSIVASKIFAMYRGGESAGLS